MKTRSVSVVLATAVMVGVASAVVAQPEENGRGPKGKRPQGKEFKREDGSAFMRELRQYGEACKKGQEQRARAIERRMQRRLAAAKKDGDAGKQSRQNFRKDRRNEGRQVGDRQARDKVRHRPNKQYRRSPQTKQGYAQMRRNSACRQFCPRTRDMRPGFEEGACAPRRTRDMRLNRRERPGRSSRSQAEMMQRRPQRKSVPQKRVW